MLRHTSSLIDQQHADEGQMCCEERGTNGERMNGFSARKICIVTARCHALTLQVLTNPAWLQAESVADTKTRVV